MNRKKRSKQRVSVGPKMRAVAGQQPGSPASGLTDIRSSEKAALFEELAQSLARTAASAAEQEARSENGNDPANDNQANQTAELTRLLAEVATGLWRLRLKMLPEGANQPAEENRRSYRQLESV